MATKAKNTIGVIEGTLVYAKVGQPDTAYQSTEKEWSVEVIVSEEDAEKWDAQFKKQPAKKIKSVDFEAKYRIPVPANLQGEKNVYGIKLKRKATNDGVPVDDNFRPKVYIDDAEGNRTEVGQSRLVANGSFGQVSYYVSSNDFGTFSRLQNLRMDEDKFIEYQSSGGAQGSEFGNKPVKTEAPREEVLNTRAEKPTKPKKVEQEEYEEDQTSPF